MTMRQCKIMHLNDLSEIGWRNMQDASQEVRLDGVHICAAKKVCISKTGGCLVCTFHFGCAFIMVVISAVLF